MTTPAVPQPHAAATAAAAAADLDVVFPGDSEMARRCRAFDWAATPLGPVAGWPSSLRTVVGVCLASPGPMCLSWGPELVLVYNDGYRAVLGAAKHPGALGRPTREVWAEVWDQIAPDFAGAMAGGPAVAHEDQRLVIRRDGRDEETFFSYAFVPVRDEAGRVGGGLHVMTETTGRVRAEAALRAERERLASIVLAMPAPVALHWGPEHRLTVVNAAFRRVSGGRDVTGLTPAEAYPELAGQGILERFDEVVATGAAWVAPETPVRYDRSGLGPEDLWFDLRYEPVRDPDGRVVGVLNFSIDVTNQVRARREVEGLLAGSEAARAALAASEARFRAVQDTSPLGFAIHRPLYGPDGNVVDFTIPYVNEAGARIVGHPREHLLAGTVLGIWPGTGPEGVFADYVRVLETGEPGYREILYEHDGLAAGLTLTVVRIGNGADAEVGVTFTDVTARLRAERERERLLADTEAARAAADLERRRLLATVDQLPVGVHVAEAPSGRLVLDNAALRRIVGEAPASERVADYSADYSGYRPGPEPEAERRLASHEWPLARALAAGAPVADELVEVRRADGTRRLVSISATPVRDAGGRVVGGVAAVADVTERERLLDAAREAAKAERAARGVAEVERARAEAASAARAQFLAVMSHELRTPLNAIGGYAELIELGVHGPVTDAQRAALERVQRAQRHLLGLINGVLNYARIDAGAVQYDLTDVDLDEVLATCEALTAPQVRAKGLTLAHDDCDATLRVRADREKLQQVVLNLLSNAIKFTEPGGGITLHCAADGDAPGGGTVAAPAVRVRVTDTGLGIAPDQLARVFEPFVQVDARLTRTQEGTGLGLAISRDLARGMGGDLTAESRLGVGSTFTLTLPAA